MYLGKTKINQEVRISKEAPNLSTVVTGVSGSGKSERVADMENHIIHEGGTVLAFDLDGTHPEVDNKNVNVIDARRDGIPLKILDPDILKRAPEDVASYVSSVAEVLLSAYRSGDRQMGVLREAIMFGLKHRDRFICDFEAIEEGLNVIGTNTALGVRDKIWPLLRCNIFRKGQKVLHQGKINIISLKGIDYELKKVVSEMCLRAFWNHVRNTSLANKVTIVIDEFQNMPMGKKSTIFEMMREARKYGINMILSTQTVMTFSKEALSAIDQAAVHLYFHPASNEVKKIAAQIAPDNVEKITSMLQKLKVGESLVSGDIEANNRVISYPIIIRTDFKKGQYTENCTQQLLRRI